MNVAKNDKIAIFGSLFSFIVFALLLRQSGISTGSAVNIQNTFLQSFLVGEGGTLSAVASLLQPFIPLLAAFLFFSLSLAFLSSYGYFYPNKRLGLIIGVVEAVIFVALFQSIASVLIALSILIAAPFVILLSNTYGKELKRWINFRVGSNSIGKVLLIINIFIALGIFFSVLMSVSFYQNSFRTHLKDALTEAVSPALAQQAQGQLAQQFDAQIKQQLEQQIDVAMESPFFLAYFRWLPVISALGVWIILEFLRNLIFSNAGGVFAHFLIKLNKKFSK